jgi:hypothetical protein
MVFQVYGPLSELGGFGHLHASWAASLVFRFVFRKRSLGADDEANRPQVQAALKPPTKFVSANKRSLSRSCHSAEVKRPVRLLG